MKHFAELLERMIQYPEGQHYMLGPNYFTLQRIQFNDFAEYCKANRWAVQLFNNPPKLKLGNGAMLHGIAATGAPNRIRGVEIDTVIIDEADGFIDETVLRAVAARVRVSHISRQLYSDLQPMIIPDRYNIYSKGIR